MNPYINTEEEEIDLLDLVRYLLRKAVPILLAGVVCAGLGGLYKFYGIKHSVKETVEESETQQNSELEEYVQQSELIDASDESTAEVIRRQKDYLRNSLYMQLDPNHVWKAQAMFRVVSHDKNIPAYQLKELYRFELSNMDSLNEAANERGVNASYLRELISSWSVEGAEGTSDDTKEVILLDQNKDDRVTSELFCVQSIGNTEQEALELMDAVVNMLESSAEDYKQKYPHEFQILSRHCMETVEPGIITTQKDREIVTQSLLNQMKDNRDKTTLLEKTETEEVSISEGVSKKSILKYGLIGLFGGVFLMCMWYTLCYMRNDKLVGYKDLERKGFLLKDLGSSSDQGVAMIAANVRNFAGDKRRLFMTGMAEQEEFNKICSSLKDYLSTYELVVARDSLHDSKAREVLLDCDAAILVEQRKVTNYSDIENETAFLFNADKDIIGIVII